MSKEVLENISNAKVIEKSGNFNNRSYNVSSSSNEADNRNSSFRTSSITEMSGLPPLIISKNPIKAPGLSNRQSNLNQQNRQYNTVYSTKTVKRTSTDNSTKNETNTSVKTEISNHDESFSTQDLRDISNNELIMNSAKRPKL